MSILLRKLQCEDLWLKVAHYIEEQYIEGIITEAMTRSYHKHGFTFFFLACKILLNFNDPT